MEAATPDQGRAEAAAGATQPLLVPQREKEEEEEEASLLVLPSGDLSLELPAAVAGLNDALPEAIGAIADNLQRAVEGLAPGAKGVGVTLDPSAWPIVHGTRGSEDRSALRQPNGQDAGQRFYLFNSQSVQEDEEANALYMGHLLMQNMGGGGSAATEEGQGYWDEAGALMDFRVDDANAVSVITERVSETETRLWTSTIGNVVVFRQVAGASGLQRLATFDHGRNTRFHGSYAFVASNGTENGFFTTMEDRVVRFVLRGSDRDGWRILQTGEQALPRGGGAIAIGNPLEAGGNGNGSEDDHLVGLTLLDDGTVVGCSKRGVLVAVRLDHGGDLELVDYLRLNDHAQAGPAWVSNSISSSGQGVFVVTHRELARVDFDARAQRFGFRWTRVYHEVDQPWYVGRLGAGSGSTPTVTRCGGRELVVITDGGLPMRLLWHDAATGALAGHRTVQFAPDEGGSLPTTSEQSVAVDGCKAFVVQNYMGTDALDDDVTCASAPRKGSALRRRLGGYCRSRLDPAKPHDLFPVRACPVVFGCSAFGAALYEIDASANATDEVLAPVRRVWAREDVSCGTSIPLISTHPASPIVYCAGLKRGSNQWALLGMDLATGQDRTNLQFYDRNLALNALANPFYAGVEATGDNMVTIGAIGGVLHLSPERPRVFPDGLGGNDEAAAHQRVSSSGRKDSSSSSSSFLSVPPSNDEGVVGATGASEQQQQPSQAQRGSLRLIEDRVRASSSSSASARLLLKEGLTQEALGGVVLLSLGCVLLLLMRWRRAGPWSPRMPR